MLSHHIHAEDMNAMDANVKVEHHDDHDHDHEELLPTIDLRVKSAQEKRAEIHKAFNESYNLYD
jgi:hypothetical protein